MSLRSLAALVVLACCACDVGQPLVDKAEQPPNRPILPCAMPPRCDEPLMMLDPIDHPAKPIAGCASPTFCQLGDAALGPGGCTADVPLDALPTDAKCRRLELRAKPDSELLQLNEVDWSEVNLELSADHATTFTMSGGSMQSVHVALHGPIALHLEHLQLLSDLRVEGEATGNGAPSLTLDNGLAKQLSVGTTSADFPGSINLHALQLSDADIRAQRIVIESASIDKASLRADTINTTDFSLKLANVEASNALWSVYAIEDSFIKLCGDARLIDGDFNRVGISSCLDAPLRVYSGRINSSTLDGSFELDQASVNNSRLAVNDQTRVLAFQTSMMSTGLCENIEQLALGPASYLKCSGCGYSTDDQPFCMLKPEPQLDTQLDILGEKHNPLKDNYCKAWNDLTVPDCDDDLPTRPDRRR